MNNALKHRPDYDDEISLVDLAATFIRRRRVFYVVFVVVTLAGLAYALLAPEKYEYTSLYQMAEVDSGEYVEAPATTIATLETRWLPELQSIHRELEEEKLPFEVTFSNPENTGLIRMASEASPERAELVKETHEKLIAKVQERQQTILTKAERSLNSRIEATNKAIEALQGGEDTSAAIAAAYEKRGELEGQLDALKQGEALVVSRESTEQKGPARSLIVILAAMLGAMSGIFLAFFCEFVINVRNSLADNAS